jgi:GTPase SAR1 family protein
MILEVTLKTNHSQWMDETASIMEHLEEFIDRSQTKDNFCLFISPSIHERAAKAYFQANKNGFGSDKKLPIIPLKHEQFCKILKLQLWDSAGQEKYKSLIPSYLRGASIIFVVYDATSKLL